MPQPPELPGDPFLRLASRLFRLAAHPLRLRILLMLSQKGAGGLDLQEELTSTGKESVRSHLNVLCVGGLLRRQTVGRSKRYQLTSLGQRVVAACVILRDEATTDPATLAGSNDPRPSAHPILPRTSSSRGR
jgi:DNA-binding transcriptional ArsR family regulator